jgi:hypothetical protein
MSNDECGEVDKWGQHDLEKQVKWWGWHYTRR